MKTCSFVSACLMVTVCEPDWRFHRVSVPFANVAELGRK